MPTTGTNRQPRWTLVNCAINQCLLQACHTCSRRCHSYRRHELSFHRHIIYKISKQIAYLQRAFIPASRYARVIKIDQDFPQLWSQMYYHLFKWNTVYLFTNVVGVSRKSVSSHIVDAEYMNNQQINIYPFPINTNFTTVHTKYTSNAYQYPQYNSKQNERVTKTWLFTHYTHHQ